MTAPAPATSLAPSRVCGLLYCAQAAETHVNLAAGGQDPLAIYVANALLLAKSAAAQALPFTLVTNDAARVRALLSTLGDDAKLEVREETFALDVPAGIAFHSAHFKLELLALFGRGDFGPLPALVDLDAVIHRPLHLPDGERLWAYDITDHLDDEPAMRASLERLAGRELTRPRWYGGEFLAGPARAFAALAERVRALWPLYAAQHETLIHAGDEMVLSAALNTLAQDGMAIGEAGAGGLVTRYWSRRTRRRLKPLDTVFDAAILHLPADKPWLAGQSRRPFAVTRFDSALRRRALRRIPAEHALVLAERVLGRPPQTVHRIR